MTAPSLVLADYVKQLPASVIARGSLHGEEARPQERAAKRSLP
jgi:hypothetical protein